MKPSAPISLAGQRRGFTLLELLIASALFAMAIMAIGQAVLYSIEAQSLIEDTQHIRRAVTQRAEDLMAAREKPASETVDLTGAFEGISITQEVEPVTLTHQPETDGESTVQIQMLRVTLTGSQPSQSATAEYSLIFYVQG